MLNPRTLKKFLSDLQDADDVKRRNAAQALGEADERAVYSLIKALGDESYGVQDAAMRSLISIGGETVAYMVLPLLREESYLRNTAIIILKELGRVSVPLVYPLLKDKDEDIRKFCLDLLGEIRDDVLPENIMPFLSDPNANVRCSAIKAIGDLMHKAATEEVIKALDDEEWVRFAALDTLARLGAEEAVGPVARLLASQSPALRLAAIETLGEIGSKRATDPLLAHARASGGDEKIASIKSLVQIGITPSMSEVGGILLDMLRDAGDWDEKMIALKGLVGIGDKGAIGTIIDVAGSLDRSVPEEEARLYEIEDMIEGFECADELLAVLGDPALRFKGKVIAAEMSGRLKCAEAVPMLIELMGKETRDVRRACAQALGKIGTPEARKALMGVLKDHDSHLRKSAIFSLGELCSKGAFAEILSLLDTEKYHDVLEEIVKALIKIDAKALTSSLSGFGNEIKEAIGRFSEDMEILLRLSEDPDLGVRLSAIAGLGRLRDKKAEARLLDAAKDPEPEVRRTAVMALSGSGCCYDALAGLVEDEDMWVRLYAVRSLGESGREDMVEALKAKLKDQELPVALAAVEALGMIGSKEAVRLLRTLLGHSDEAIREAALRALDSA